MKNIISMFLLAAGAFIFTQLNATPNNSPDWILVEDVSTGEVVKIDDNSPCLTHIVVYDNGYFETEYYGLDC